MRKRAVLFKSALVFLPVLAGTAMGGENFTLRIRGTPEETTASVLSLGKITNFEGVFSILRKENAVTARVSAHKQGPAVKLRGMQAGGEFSLDMARKEDGSIQGFLHGDEIFFNIPAEGVSLEEGVFRAAVKNRTLEVESAEFNGRGRLRAGGSIVLEPGEFTARLDLEMEDFPVFERPDRQLWISGEIETESGGGKTRASGNFRIERAVFYIAEFDATSPPSMDITVISEEPPPAYTHPLEEAFLRIDLGENLRVKSRELDVRLEGELEIRLLGGEPVSVSGSVRAAEGSYKAYGQEMYIERGMVTFTGPPDNPGLDILALHKHRKIDVGIRISGTLAAPEIELYSYPDMPEVEKLSYLVLGRSFGAAGRADAGLIAAAAAAILAPEEYARLESEIQKTTGLDEIRLAPDNEREETVVILGKQISSRLYLTYRRGLAGMTSAAMLEYFMSPRWIVRAEAGYDNVVGITYSISFD